MQSLNFIDACLRNSSRLVRNIADYCIQYGRHELLIGCSALLCSRRYNFRFQDLSDGNVGVELGFNNYVNGLIQTRQMQTARFIRELLCLTGDVLELSNKAVFTNEELEQ
jgi:hypothetical protein